MEKLLLSIPTLYADHHTAAVRTILNGLKGLSEIFVSSAAKQVALSFDPKLIGSEAIEAALAEHGYATGDGEPVYPASPIQAPSRHSSAIQAAGSALTFQQTAPGWQGRPLWPCPGLSYQTTVMDES
jgi:copper chaperone CopZ